jgi:DNA-binding NarL/FixJ family response regulator
MTAIRVLLVDDHAVLRAGLRLLIEAHRGLEVVGEASDAGGAAELAARTQPDVVVMDLALRGSSGVDATAAVRVARPQARVLVLTMHEEPAYLRAAFAAGATGYVLKQAADGELIDAIHIVARGLVWLDPALGPGALAGGGGGRDLGVLSAREREVFVAVARGETSAAIAARLGLSPKSVETYRARLMRKLGLASRVDLVRCAVENGVLASGDPRPPT